MIQFSCEHRPPNPFTYPPTQGEIKQGTPNLLRTLPDETSIVYPTTCGIPHCARRNICTGNTLLERQGDNIYSVYAWKEIQRNRDGSYSTHWVKRVPNSSNNEPYTDSTDVTVR
jgi:hypothetical protein